MGRTTRPRGAAQKSIATDKRARAPTPRQPPHDSGWLAGLDAVECAELERAVARARQKVKANQERDPLRAWAVANLEALQPRPIPVADGSPEHRRRCGHVIARGGLAGRATATRSALRMFEVIHLDLALSTFEPQGPKLRGRLPRTTVDRVELAIRSVGEWCTVRRAASVVGDLVKRKAASNTGPSPTGMDADSAVQRFVAACLDEAADLVAQAEVSIKEAEGLHCEDPTNRRRAYVEMLHAALDRSPAKVARLLVESMSWRSPPCPTFLRDRGVRTARDPVPDAIVDLIKQDLKRVPWNLEKTFWSAINRAVKRWVARGLPIAEAQRFLAAVEEGGEREAARLRSLTDAEARAETLRWLAATEDALDEDERVARRGP